MAEEGSSPIDYKNLHDLRVVDLKKELEKRGLSKSGSKKDLVERLKTQLKIEELREKSKSTSEGVSAQAPSIQLSEGGHNEIVKNYLQQREKLYEQQMEQKKKYQEEASRSQESESQSETDDGTSSQMKPGKLELVGANKLSDVEEDQADDKNGDEAAEEQHDTAADPGKGNDYRTKDREEPMDDLPAGSLEKGGERRARSRSSSVASSRSAERSQSGSRSESEEKKPSQVTAGPSNPLPKRVTQSRSPSVEEVRSGSSSPEGSSLRAKQSPRSTQPVSRWSKSPPAKKVRCSRSASSSGSESPAEDQKKPMNLQKRRSFKESTSHRSGSESSKRSFPQEKGSRSRSSSSSGSSASPSRERLPLDESDELQQQRKKLGSSSSSGTEDESRGKLQRKSRSSSRSSVDADEDTAADKPVDEPKLAEEKKTLPLKSGEGENLSADAGEDRAFAEPKQAPAEFRAAGDGLEVKHDKTEPKIENVTSMDQVILSRSEQDNDGKGEDTDVKPTRKRRWGSTTLKTITRLPSVNVSTESLKAMIPEMKVSALLPELMPELDIPSLEPQNHQDSPQAKTAEAEEGQEEAEVAEAASGSVPEEGAAKHHVPYKSPESTKQKGQESVKLSRTIFQVVKADDEYEEYQELNKSSEKMDTEELVPESEAVVESNGRKVVEVTKGAAEQDKKAETTKEVRRVSRLQVPVIPVDDPQPVGRRSPSPAKNSATNIIHIHRLVRPYTLGQLKELLSQTGSITDDGFWIDKIKSHCLVVYNSVDEAVATRRALHGKRWPLSNPNVLRIEYSTLEEFDMFKNAKDGVIPKPVIKPEESQEKKKEERVRPPADLPKELRDPPEKKELAKPAAKEVHPRAKERSPPVREWDRDKIRQSRSRSRDRIRKEERTASRGATGPREKERQTRDQSRDERRKRRASSPEHKEKKEKVEAEPPAKLLDDLFRKTKAMPCIYWLPLTEEQIAQKMAAQQQMAAEREQRRQERERQQMEEEREQKAATRARDDRVAKENKRDDRRPDRRDRSLDTKQKEPEDGVKKGGASGVPGSRSDRTVPRR